MAKGISLGTSDALFAYAIASIRVTIFVAGAQSTTIESTLLGAARFVTFIRSCWRSRFTARFRTTPTTQGRIPLKVFARLGSFVGGIRTFPLTGGLIAGIVFARARKPTIHGAFASTRLRVAEAGSRTAAAIA